LPTRFDDKMLGTLIHKELYLWAEYPHLKSRPITEHFPRWSAMLLEAGLPELHLSWMGDVMQRVQTDARAQWILSAHSEAMSEYQISLFVDGAVKTFIIDRTFIDENGVRVIVDYKTGLFDESVFEKHRAQLEGYASAMQQLEERPIQLCLYFPVTGGWRQYDH
jgi:ATP-dependent helicase/nuclease subunit A